MAQDPHRILVVYEEDPALVANIEVARGLDAALSAGLSGPFEIYSEYRDNARFPGADHDRQLAGLMAGKYADMPLDAVLAAGPGALEFVLANRAAFAPGSPVVFGAVTARTLARIAPPGDVSGVVTAFDLRKTVDLARLLQPAARQVVVMSGSSAFDRSWEERARIDLAGRPDGMETRFVSGLTLEGFTQAAAALPPETILVVLTILEDAAGQRFLPRKSANRIAAAAAAPTYGVYDTFIGEGVVGGEVTTFTSIGAALGDMTVRLIDGAAPGERSVSPSRPVLDWRQVRRWNLAVEGLPATTERLFYVPTLWERFSREIVAVLIVILLQGVTIAALILQSRRRRRVEADLLVERLEIAHLSRRSQLGELSGALAHELNQPLTAILANAEAGSVLAQRDPPDMGEIRAILTDIATDDRRAAAIITQLRRLMIKGEATLEPMDLNQAVAATIALLRSEMIGRQTSVNFSSEAGELPVLGNLPQLQQILVNLIVNASDAMSALPSGERRILIRTRLRDDGARELSVRDHGKGMAPDLRETAFRPFVTSKQEGLGFGLAICRSIAQAHGGTLDFDPAVTEGARIVLVLPVV